MSKSLVYFTDTIPVSSGIGATSVGPEPLKLKKILDMVGKPSVSVALTYTAPFYSSFMNHFKR